MTVLSTGLVPFAPAMANCYPSNPGGTYAPLDAFDTRFGVPCLNSPPEADSQINEVPLRPVTISPYSLVDQTTGQSFQTGQGRNFVNNGVPQAQTSGFWTGSSVEVQRNGTTTTTIRDSNGTILTFPR